VKRFEKSHHKKKNTHTQKEKKHQTTKVALSQTLSILHLLDGYHFIIIIEESKRRTGAEEAL
jgi:hypothetical protein